MTLFSALRWGFAASFCAFAYYVVRADYADQKIRNRPVLLGLAAVFAGYAVLLAHTWAGGFGPSEPYLQWPFYRDALLHGGVSLAAALGLWRWGIWPAGDAKLFFMLSLWYPLATLPDTFDPWRLSLIALINAFIPAALVMMGRAIGFIWRLYLAEQAKFLSLLGWEKLPGYLMQGKAGAGALLAAAKASLLSIQRQPGAFLLSSASWGVSVALTSTLMLRLNPLVHSTLLTSGLCMLLLFGWQRLWRELGTAWALPAGAALVLFAFDFKSPEAPAAALRMFASVSLFSLSLNWGVSLVRRLLEEKGLVIAPLLGMATWIVPMLLMQLAPAGGAGRDYAVWAALGFVFGLGYMLVRILETHDCPTVRPEELRSTHVLNGVFVDLLRQDPEYFEDEIGTLYADGLTRDQAESVRRWCGEHGIGLVPLHATVSFAFWICTGFALTWLLRAHLLQKLVS